MRRQMARILLLEDDHAQATLLTEVLALHDHQVLPCDTLASALEALSTQAFDLVITDLLIKENGRYSANGGLVLINRLRIPKQLAAPNWPIDIPIVAISGGFGAPHLEAILQSSVTLGANLCLAKPLDLRRLPEIIDSLLSHPVEHSSAIH